MQTISLDDVYNVRPDIFIKGAEDRLHVQYAGKNFILRLQHEVINSLYDCLGRIDGIRPMGEVLTALPAPHHASALKFIDFLIQQKAAFRVANPRDELELAPVKDTLSYLRLYSDDSAGQFRRFEQKRLLIVADGYALISAIKTFARLGVRVLTVLDAGADPHVAWSEAELQACFAELRRWPEARLLVHTSPGAAMAADFDHVLHVLSADSAPHQAMFARHADAEQLVAQPVHGNLCLLRSADHLRIDGRFAAAEAVSQPGALIFGATAALFFFDHLCDIRRLREGRYHYYKLTGESVLRFGQLHRLCPIDALAAAAASDAGATATVPDLDKLLRQPLFPLQAFVEQTEPSSYLKLYAATLPGAAGQRPTLVAAGRSKAQCQANLLAQLIAAHGLWFDQALPAERQAALQFHAGQVQARQAVQALRAPAVFPRQPAAPELSGHESYISFCISATFGQRLRWFEAATGDPLLPACTLLCADEFTVFLPHGGELAGATREAGLLAMYAALWQLRQGGVPLLDVVHAASPFLLDQPDGKA